MSERSDLLESIARTIKDYRKGEIHEPTAQHVDRWIRQFDTALHIPMLRELDHVLDNTYFSRTFVSDFFLHQIKHEKLAGTKPCEFWRAAHLLNIQQKGHSQTEILKLFREKLEAQCGVSVNDCGSADGSYIYLDDVLFSGSRIGTDLKAWTMDDAPASANVHVLVIASHRLGEWLCFKGLRETAAAVGKKINFDCWAAVRFENRFKYRNKSEVLWPATVPEDAGVKAYIAQQTRFPFQPRQPGGKLEHDVFSSEEGRQLLERELLLAGIRILEGCADPKPIIRPLGFSAFGLGFGSMIVTYRNCPNNCPLALWWGDPNATSGPFHWYPLLPRNTYASSIDDFDVIEL